MRCLLWLAGAIISWAQPYAIGHRSLTYTDPSRSNRPILTELYYPALSAGDNVPVANGSFPLVVFAHGFVMSWEAYQWLWDSLARVGYVVALPRTESGFSPSHQNFALDLRFLNEKILSEGSSSSSFLYQRLSGTSAIAGHSMGGGASVLAAQNYTNVTVVFNFAAAETSPSAIHAAKHVTVPILFLAGENDGVTPPSAHQIRMYDSCLSSCKTLVTIKGGGHCYFANYNFNCSFGESTTSPQPTITREEQLARTMAVLRPYLDHHLKGDANALSLFLSRIQHAHYTYQRTCGTTTLLNRDSGLLRIYPDPARKELILETKTPWHTIQLMNPLGQILGHWDRIEVGVHYLRWDDWRTGLYWVRACTREGRLFTAPLLLHL